MVLIVRRDYETNKNKAFTVINQDKSSVHSVIYKGDKDSWTCDCKWYSIKMTDCKHIKAVKKKQEEQPKH